MASAKKKDLAKKNQFEQYPRNAAETKQRILEAARTLFSRDGYSKIGTREIAAKAGVNLTLINRYFGSKKKLFTEVVMSLKGAAPDSPGTAKERALAAIMDFLSEEENERKKELRLILLSAMDSDVSDVVSDFFLQRRKAQAKLLRGDNKETTAVLIFSLIAGIALSSLLFHASDRKMLNKAYMKEYISELLDKLYCDGESSIDKNG